MRKFVSGVGVVEMTAEEETAFLAQQALDQQAANRPAQVNPLTERIARLEAALIAKGVVTSGELESAATQPVKRT